MNPDLVALDDALAGRESPLAELVADVRALGPAIDPGFERRLGERVAAGFAGPPARPAGSRPRRAPRRRSRGMLWSGGVAGVLAASALVAVLAGSSGGPSSPVPTTARSAVATAPGVKAAVAPSASGAGGAAASAQSSAAASAPAIAPAPPVPAPGGPSSASGPRQQVQSGELTLAPDRGHLDEVAQGVQQVTAAAGGYVASSQVNDGANGSGSATFALVVPAGKLADVINGLSQLATVQSESRAAQDVTDSVNAARRALQDAVAHRQALLRALANATTPGQIASLREQLRLAEGQVAQANSTYQSLLRQTRLAQLQVYVQTRDAAAGAGTFGAGRGLHDAGRVLSALAGGALVVAAVLVPVGLVLALIAAAWRPLRRTRRERVLEGL
jgi:Domain of unknown function (DUF4349)